MNHKKLRKARLQNVVIFLKQENQVEQNKISVLNKNENLKFELDPISKHNMSMK